LFKNNDGSIDISEFQFEITDTFFRNFFSFTNTFIFIDNELKVDVLSSIFNCLSAFLLVVIVLLSFSIKVDFNKRFFFATIFFMFAMLFITFMTVDMVLFYSIFEFGLIPMMLLIGVFGSRPRKILATYRFLFYTFFGSLFMLVCIIYIYSNLGNTNFIFVRNYGWTSNELAYFWIACFIAFAVKIPIFPFHGWLPEAHVEASTIGSVILAGIMLKIGVYGLIRFNFEIFGCFVEFWQPFVIVLCVVSILYSSVVAIMQTDMKKMIAYASISHMNLAVVGLFVNSTISFKGALFVMVSHGIISSGLFICVGELYRRYGSRHIDYYGDLVRVVPHLSIVSFFFILGNIALPLTSGFVGELLIYTGIIKNYVEIFIFTSPQIILTAAYSFTMYNRVFFGNKLSSTNNIKFGVDIGFFEGIAIYILVFLMFFLGIAPGFFVDYISNYVV